MAGKILNGDKLGEMTPEQAAKKAISLRNALQGNAAPSTLKPFNPSDFRKPVDGKKQAVSQPEPVEQKAAPQLAAGVQ